MSKPVWMLFQTYLCVKRYLFDGNFSLFIYWAERVAAFVSGMAGRERAGICGGEGESESAIGGAGLVAYNRQSRAERL
jgi:hypothetical protein